MSGVTQHNNFIYLTIALVLLLLVSAMGNSVRGGISVHFGQIMTVTTLSVSYLTLNFGPRWRHFVGLTLLLCLALAVIDFFTSAPEVTLAYRVVGLLFFIGATVKCSHQVLFTHITRTNAIVGTLTIYLLLGLMWASLYAITLYFAPDAFKGITPEPGVDSFPRILYFSYVTLATLGYGDISPAIPMSKTLAYLQAITGTFYLAIIVASLIGGRLKK